MLEILPEYWLALGIFLVVIEFAIPGTMVLFFGLGAVVTALVTYLWPLPTYQAILLWILASSLTLLVGGQFLKRLFPSETTKESHPTASYLNEVVLVTQDIKPLEKGGRIRFQGADWDAYSLHNPIPTGSKVRILRRESISFVVEPIES